VRFHRALYAHKPGWQKWDFDPAAYPLLRQIQDGQGEILAQSFMGETRFYVDYIELETLEACTFPDPEKAIVFIGLTPRLIDELLSLTAILAASAEVATLVGIPASSSAGDVADALFFLTLQFVIAHEVGHYACGHIVDRALHFEYSGPAVYQPADLRRHADELDADEYATLELCRNVLDGDTGPEIVELLPSGGRYGDDQLAALLAISVTAVFLLHLSQPLPAVGLAKDKHPPLAHRQHRIIEIMQRWLTTHGKSTAAVTGAGHHAIMKAVGNALPAELRPRWDAQVKVLTSPAGRDYRDALDKLPD